MFHIDFEVTIRASDGEAEQFLTQYDGEIFVYCTETDENEHAGRVSLFLVFDPEDDSNLSLYDVLDLQQRTFPYTALLHKTDAGNFRPAVLRILKEDDMVMSRNMIILDRLEILPKFRGKRLGLHIMQACLDQFSGESRIAAIKPFPLQLEGAKERRSPVERSKWKERMKLEAFPTDERRATARLKKYYAQLGFVAVRGTELMIRDLYARHVPLALNEPE